MLTADDVKYEEVLANAESRSGRIQERIGAPNV
jgi:hypothetical protein